MRSDIPSGLQGAQLIHASGESALLVDSIPPGTHAVALTADSEEALLIIADALSNADIPHIKIIENDPPYSDQLMAIGIIPLQRTSKIKQILGRLRLLK